MSESLGGLPVSFVLAERAGRAELASRMRRCVEYMCVRIFTVPTHSPTPTGVITSPH
jgi:hypothetical protein